MSSCQCCFKPHPHQLLQRYSSAIHSIKCIRKTSIILEDLLLDKSEQVERILVNVNNYFIQDVSSSHLVTSHCIRLIKQLNDRLNQSMRSLAQLEGLVKKCSIWLKKNNKKTFRRQLKSFCKQFDRLHQFDKDFPRFHREYHQQTLHMDAIEYEHLKLFLDSYRIFASSLLLEKPSTTIDIEQIIQEWNEQNRFHIPWLSNEHKTIEHTPSEIDIQPIDDGASQDTYAYASNLSWSFTVPLLNDDLSGGEIASTPSQSMDQFDRIDASKNRVRLAIEAIERNQSSDFPRGRKS